MTHRSMGAGEGRVIRQARDVDWTVAPADLSPNAIREAFQTGLLNMLNERGVLKELRALLVQDDKKERRLSWEMVFKSPLVDVSAKGGTGPLAVHFHAARPKVAEAKDITPGA